MKAAVVYGINDLRLEEIEKPQIERDDQILVKIKAVGICGSDIHILHGANPFATYPRIMGHEMVGEVEAVGDNVKNIAIGDHIVVEPITKCERKAPKFIYGDISSLKNNDSISLFFIVLYF